jgi:hypothetical protein
MRHSSLLLPLVVLVSVVLAGVLYLFGGALFNTPPGTLESSSGLTYAVAAEGTDAIGIDRRVNYRLRSEEEYAMLWDEMFMGNGPTRPSIDFARDEVLAVFNGTHSTTGHAVTVSDIKDADGVRTVTILRYVPGEACAVSSQITSPYAIVRAPKSALPIQRIEQETVSPCQ